MRRVDLVQGSYNAEQEYLAREQPHNQSAGDLQDFFDSSDVAEDIEQCKHLSLVAIRHCVFVESIIILRLRTEFRGF